MKSILALGSVLTIAMVSSSCKGEISVDFFSGDGFRMTAPEIVTNGIPANWSVCITNASETVSRIDVAAEVVAISYDGVCVAKIFRSATTNQLDVGEAKRLSFSLPPDWVPSGDGNFDSIEFSTGISLRDVGRFSANWIRAEYVGNTNGVEAVE